MVERKKNETFLDDFNTSAEKKQDCSANKHIHYLLKFEEKNQLASETLPGQQEGPKADKQTGKSVWMRRSFRFTCEYTEAAGPKADPATCSWVPQDPFWQSPPRGSAKPTPKLIRPLPKSQPAAAAPLGPKGAKIVGSTETNGVKLELSGWQFFFFFCVIISQDL